MWNYLGALFKPNGSAYDKCGCADCTKKRSHDAKTTAKPDTICWSHPVPIHERDYEH